MTNLEKYNKAFTMTFGKKEDVLPTLKYRGIPEWDSVGHMDLVVCFEELFDIMLETTDILEITSYEKGKEILGRYGITIS